MLVVAVVSKGDVPVGGGTVPRPASLSPQFRRFQLCFQAFWMQYPSDSAAWVRTAPPCIAESMYHIIVALAARWVLGQCTT